MLGALEDKADKEMGEVIEFMLKFNRLCIEYYDFTHLLEDPFKYEIIETIAEVGHNYSEVRSFGSCTPDIIIVNKLQIQNPEF